MPIDAIALAVGFREISEASHIKKSYQLSATHYVQPREALDPSLTNQFVYGNRADWLVSAATSGFVDVDKPIVVGARRFIPLIEAVAITQKALGTTKKNGMKLYE